MRSIFLYIAVLGCVIISSVEAMPDPIGSQLGMNSTVEISHLVSIGEILNNSDKFNGELVTIEGTYLGWSGQCIGALLTRSDWCIRDETGTIYVTGLNPSGIGGLDPLNDVGAGLIVSGKVLLISDGPLLQGKIVTLTGKSRNESLA